MEAAAINVNLLFEDIIINCEDALFRPCTSLSSFNVGPAFWFMNDEQQVKTQYIIQVPDHVLK